MDEEEVDEAIKESLKFKLIECFDNGKEITYDEFINLPKERQDNCTFINTERGKELLKLGCGMWLDKDFTDGQRRIKYGKQRIH